MEPLVDFDTFYTQQLLPVLPGLREQSLASRRWLMITAASGILGFTYFVLYTYLHYNSLAPLFILFVIFLVGLIFYIRVNKMQDLLYDVFFKGNLKIIFCIDVKN